MACGIVRFLLNPLLYTTHELGHPTSGCVALDVEEGPPANPCPPSSSLLVSYWLHNSSDHDTDSDDKKCCITN